MILFSGNAAGQAIPIILAPVISRLYLPSDFGLFSIYLSFVGIAAVVSTGRYELAILLPRRTTIAESLLRLSLGLAAATAIVSCAVLLILDLVIGITDRNPIGNWIALLPAAMLLRGAIQALTFFHTRWENYGTIAATKIAQGGTLAATQIALGLTGFGTGGLIIGSIASYVTAATVCGAGTLHSLSSWKSHRIKSVLAALRRYRDFPKYNMPHSALRVATTNLPVVVLSIHFTDAEVGLYAMCYGTTMLPLSLISQSIFQVFSRELSQRWSNGAQCALDLARSLLRKLVLATGVPAVIAVAVAPTAFAFVLGDQWRESGVLFRLMAPMIIMSFISTNFSFIPQLLGRQRRAMVLEVVGFTLMIVSLGVGGAVASIEVALLLFSASAALLTGYRLMWYFSLLDSKAREAAQRR